MKNICLVLICAVLVSCSKEQNLELEIITKEVKSLEIDSEKYGYFMSLDSLTTKKYNKAKTIVTYKLRNNTDKTFFFNVKAFDKKLKKMNCIKLTEAYSSIFDNENNLITVDKSESSRFMTNNELKFELMKYELKYYSENKNFIIHPNETLYFEWFIVLPFGCVIDEPLSTVNLNSHKKYELELSMSSLNDDKAQKYLSRAELATIKENGYEIFNGTITSKNRIPIKFVK